ncbi:MAG: DUF4033 domain-containing protein [Merismopedia sp. SIO2A8]|nr:DUF4033 domain-containing protein [Merismopedia sp. SIO2A8]
MALSAPQSVPPSSTQYHDNFIDRLFIALFSRKMASALGTTNITPGYEGFVELSKRIMIGRSPKEQQAMVAVVLQSLVPAPILWGIRTFFSPTRWVCEWNAWFAAQLFEWLVGPCEVTSVELENDVGDRYSQTSNVHIKKCRYLEESTCVGLCVNLCKVPTQAFFTEKFGIPVTMNPNFEDLSCDMIFGQTPPPLEDDETVYQQPCFTTECAIASPKAPTCPNVRA